MLAVNHLTPVVGIDVHWVNLPPSPAPVPLPHPHVGMVLDLREYANAALAVMGSIVFSFVEEQVSNVMQSDLVQSGLGAVDAVMNNDVVKGGMDALKAANALQRKVSDALGGHVGSGGGGAP
ncbi:hypothetical protein QCE62_22030, partial [Caballeronia sp. LZ033]|uniref:hypothetical protein n=1 Tax=Caballeronia sp. LZ033 TaxID=3038566 RepID=UPI002860BA25